MSRTIKKKSQKVHPKGKAIDSSCQNNGSCSRCNGNRTYHNRKREQDAEEKEEQFQRYDREELDKIIAELRQELARDEDEVARILDDLGIE